jgi:FdrA protein
MKKTFIERAVYLDSISLMGISRKVGESAGIRSAMVAMATDTNLRLLEENGFDSSAVAGVSPNDLLIAIDAEDAAALEAGLALARSEMAGGTGGQPTGTRRSGERSAGAVPSGLDAALREHPEINLVLISVPGRFAAYEADKALRAGRHVMIFSDNVSVEDEIRLKALACERGLLLMGPDCGTAIINGVGLGFANDVPRGPIGIVSASGTGAQEVSSLLARMGIGVSHLIGTGGRDVSDAVGGVMTAVGLKALIDDAGTKAIVIISKLPSARVSERLLELAVAGGKPCVIYFAGHSGADRRGNLSFARTLTQTALDAATAAGVAGTSAICADVRGEKRLAAAAARLPASRKYLRGLFSGGTLGQETIFILSELLTPIATNMKLPGTVLLEDASVSQGHTVVDLGDDAFTRGRAHPMIDQSYRLARLAREVGDRETAVVLMDVVLGYGCNEDPAGEIARALGKMGGGPAGRGRSRPVVVASVCGTRGDPQNYDRQRQVLEDAGVFVAETNAIACRWALNLLGRR